MRIFFAVWLVKSKEMQTVITSGLISRGLRCPVAHSAVSEKKKHPSVSVESVHKICVKGIFIYIQYMHMHIYSLHMLQNYLLRILFCFYFESYIHMYLHWQIFGKIHIK